MGSPALLPAQVHAGGLGDGDPAGPAGRRADRQAVTEAGVMWYAWITAWPLPRAISRRLTGYAAPPAITSATARLPQKSGSVSPASSAPGISEHDQRVDDLHRRDRERVGRERERHDAAKPAGPRAAAGRSSARSRTRRRAGSRRRWWRRCSSRARCRVPCRATSPIAQPVRQWTVAANASEFSDCAGVSVAVALMPGRRHRRLAAAHQPADGGHHLAGLLGAHGRDPRGRSRSARRAARGGAGPTLSSAAWMALIWVRMSMQ